MLSKKQQREQERLVNEIAQKVRNQEFANTLQLSDFYEKERSWSAWIMKLVCDRYRLMSIEEWRKSFPQRQVKINRWQCEACGHRGKLKRITA